MMSTRSVQGKVPIEFYGRLGGMTPFPDEIYDEIIRISQNMDAPAAENPRTGMGRAA